MDKPHHPRALVLCDLDGTVIDDHGKSDPIIPELFHAAAEQNILVGWASSTSDEGLQRWEQLLGIRSGTMQVRICEDGLLITAPRGWFPHAIAPNRSQHILDRQVGRWIRRFRAIRIGLREFCRRRQLSYLGTHPSSWSMNTQRVAPPYRSIVCVDSTRLGSFTCEAKLVGNGMVDGLRPGELATASWLLQGSLSRTIRMLAVENRIPIAKLDVGDSYVDLPHPYANKGEALQHLRHLVPSTIPIYMVGNGTNDLSCAGIHSVELIAVGDSTPKLKQVAARVMRGPLYHGVIEFFRTVLFRKFRISG